MSIPVKSAGTDGAFMANVIYARKVDVGHTVVGARVTAMSFPGAELRPIAIAPPLPPVPAPRATWPGYLATAALVLALDRANVGVAVLIGIWFLGWAVRRS